VPAAHTCSMTLAHGSTGEPVHCCLGLNASQAWFPATFSHFLTFSQVWQSLQAWSGLPGCGLSGQRKQLLASNTRTPQQLPTKPGHKFGRIDKTVF